MQWVLLFVAAVVAPLVVRLWLRPTLWLWDLAIAFTVTAAVAVSVHAWRRGADALSLAPISAASVFGVLIGYSVIAPAENQLHSHRSLAQSLRRLVPSDVHTIMFFNEIDEGLWFYLRGLNLAAVPGSHPRYNTAYDLAQSYLTERLAAESLAEVERKRQARHRQALLDWLDHTGPGTSYVLVRGNLYDRLVAELTNRVTPVFRETGMKRNELTRFEPWAAGRTGWHRLHEPGGSAMSELMPVKSIANLRALADISTVPILAIREEGSSQKVGLRQLCGQLFLCKYPVLPDRDDRQFCRHKLLIQNTKRIQASGL